MAALERAFEERARLVDAHAGFLGLQRLRERLDSEHRCRYVLSGVAFRLGGGTPPPREPGIEVAVDLDFFGPGTDAPRAVERGIDRTTSQPSPLVVRPKT